LVFEAGTWTPTATYTGKGADPAAIADAMGLPGPVTVTADDNEATFTFHAPTTGCYVDVAPFDTDWATTWATAADIIRTQDTTGTQSQSIPVGGLAAETTYLYRGFCRKNFIGQLTTAGGTTNISDGLVAEHLMAEGTGQAVADSTPNNFDGTLGADSGSSTDDPAWNAGALDFDGGDYITVSEDAALRPNAATLCSGVLMTATADFPIIGWSPTGASPNWYGTVPQAIATTDRPLLFLGASNFRYWQNNDPVNTQDGGWHFMCVTIPGNAQADISSSVLYVDGQVQTVQSTTASGAQGAKNIYRIGMSGNSGAFANGSMCYQSIHNRALTDLEVASMRSYATEKCGERGITLP
jgi:hypothetical protein